MSRWNDNRSYSEEVKDVERCPGKTCIGTKQFLRTDLRMFNFVADEKRGTGNHTGSQTDPNREGTGGGPYSA